MVILVYTPNNTMEGFSFPNILYPEFVIIGIFDDSYSGWGKVLICISLEAKVVEHSLK